MTETPPAQELEVRTTPTPGGELDNRRLQGGLAVGNGVIEPARWQMLAAIAETIYNTSMVPSGLRGKKAEVIAALLYGDALGVGPMIALRGIDVIEGTPQPNAGMTTGLIQRAGHTLTYEEIRDADGRFLGCTAHGVRRDGTAGSFTFTLDMARRAGLLSKKNWQHYEEAMCWARCVTQLSRILFADVFMGAIYNEEELGSEEPIQVPAEVKPAQAPAAPTAETAPAAPEAAPTAGAPAGTGAVVMAQMWDDTIEREVGQIPESWVAEILNGSRPLPEPVADGYVAVGFEVANHEGGGHTTILNVRREAPVVGEVVPEPEEEPDAEIAAAEEAELEGDPAGAQDEKAAAADGQVLPAAEEIAKETIPAIMEMIVLARERGDDEWLKGVLAHEQSKGDKARVRLMKTLEDDIATVQEIRHRDAEAALEIERMQTAAERLKEQPTLDAAPEKEPEPTEPEDAGKAAPAPFTPGAVSAPETDAGFKLKVVKIKAVCAYLGDDKGNPDWKLDSVIASAGYEWQNDLGRPVHSLEDLEEWCLDYIWDAVPQETKDELAILEPAAVKTLAERALKR